MTILSASIFLVHCTSHIVEYIGRALNLSWEKSKREQWLMLSVWITVFDWSWKCFYLFQSFLCMILIHMSFSHTDIFSLVKEFTQMSHSVVSHSCATHSCAIPVHQSPSNNTIRTYLSFHPFFCDHFIPQTNVCDLSTTCWLQGWCQVTQRSTVTQQ